MPVFVNLVANPKTRFRCLLLIILLMVLMIVFFGDVVNNIRYGFK